MKIRVGFIGLGIMGQPMAMNILRAGYELMVYNRTRDKAAALKDKGALVATTPKEIADWSDVIILMLTGPEAIEQILESDDGLLAGDIRGKKVINMSTVSPSYTRYLDKKLGSYSAVFIDAPVSGSRKPAEEATLVILASGPENAVKETEPLFKSMGKKVVYCGEAGMGSCMKMTVNLLLGIMMEGLCEAVNFGQKCGLSTEIILETILSSPLGCGLFSLKSEMLKNKDYPPQFPLKHMLKDIRFILQTADEEGSATPVAYTVFQLYRQAAGQGLAGMDFSAVMKILESMNDRE